MTRSLTILGATGSIGRSTSEVVLAHRDEFRIEAVVGGRDAAALADTAKKLGARSPEPGLKAARETPPSSRLPNGTRTWFWRPSAAPQAFDRPMRL
jgi:1-deoxy-D-xylulose-5-phosphate reductoisomerase